MTSSNPDNESDYQRMARLIMKERPSDSASVRDRGSDSVPAVDRTDRLGILARAGYVTSGPHLSGYRLVLGFETLEEVSAAHQVIADIKRGAVETTEKPVVWVVPGDDNVNMDGFVDARFEREGEYTRPLYARPAVEPTPEPLVTWVGLYHWRCRCKSPGDVNIDSSASCKDCGTMRPVKASEPCAVLCDFDPVTWICKRCGQRQPPL